jgi:hypothetical protein
VPTDRKRLPPRRDCRFRFAPHANRSAWQRKGIIASRRVQEPTDRSRDPGPRPTHEVATVAEIYKKFVNDGLPEFEIAKQLNDRGILTDLKRPWTRGSIQQVLTNEKYIGNNVYNHSSFKLKLKRVKNPPEMWIRSDGAFEAIVDAQLYYQAQGIMLERQLRFSDEEMLDRLKHLYRRHGKLSGILIDDTEGMPSSTAYRNRFHGLVRAYRLIGYTPERDYRYIRINRFLRRMHKDIVADVIQQIQDLGGFVEKDDRTDLLTVNGEFSASVVVARCWQTRAGSLRWLIRFDLGLSPDITVALRMDAANAAPMDYYLLPLIDLEIERLRLAEYNGAQLYSFLSFHVPCTLRKQTGLQSTQRLKACL